MNMKHVFISVLLAELFSLSPPAGAQQLEPIGRLPAVPHPAFNLPSDAKITLGRQLYFDKRLSKDNTVSCASCHVPSKGFGDPRRVSEGVKGGKGNRNAPTLFNVAYQTFQFWDGRAGSLEEQALGPIQNPVEMAEPLDTLIPKLRAIPGYAAQFKAVFGTEVNADDLARAIAAFERTIISTDSALDRQISGDPKALGSEAQRGLAIFAGKGRCIQCHNGPNFTDNVFHNLGAHHPGTEEDVGRMAVTNRSEDKGRFKTPTLRGAAESAPYMHDGSLKTLEEVVAFYNKGGGKSDNLDPVMQPLNLTAQEEKDLVTFVKALSGKPLAISEPKLP